MNVISCLDWFYLIMFNRHLNFSYNYVTVKYLQRDHFISLCWYSNINKLRYSIMTNKPESGQWSFHRQPSWINGPVTATPGRTYAKTFCRKTSQMLWGLNRIWQGKDLKNSYWKKNILPTSKFLIAFDPLQEPQSASMWMHN